MSLSKFQAYDNVNRDGALILIEEISHRVMNDYARAISEIRVAAKSVEDLSARHAMLNAAQLLQSRAEAHRALQAPSSSGELDICDYLQAVCIAVSRASLADAGIQLTLSRCSAALSADRCWRLGLVVIELVNNAARHGLLWSTGEICVDVEVAQFELICTVSDNGRSATSPKRGRGSRIVSALAADLGGRVDWIFGPWGVSAVVRIPLLSDEADRGEH